MISLLAHFHRGLIRSLVIWAEAISRWRRNWAACHRKEEASRAMEVSQRCAERRGGKTGFSQWLFQSCVCVFLVNKGEPRWHIHPLWDAGRGWGKVLAPLKVSMVASVVPSLPLSLSLASDICRSCLCFSALGAVFRPSNRSPRYLWCCRWTAVAAKSCRKK